MAEFLIASIIALFIGSTAPAPVGGHLDQFASVEYNETTGTTDYTIGGQTVSFEVEHRYDFNE